MSITRINPGQLRAECEKALTEYRDMNFHRLKTVIDKTSKEVTSEIKEKAPVRKYGLRGGRYPPGSYKKSWTSKKSLETSGRYARLIYNAKHYQLAHLLQHGHALKGYFANRTSLTRVPAYPHIPSDEETAVKFTLAVERELRK